MQKYFVPKSKSLSKTDHSRICLISLYSSSSIGLRYLSAVLRNNSFDVTFVFFKEKNIALDLMELPTKKEYDLLMGLLQDISPDLVGIGVRSSFLHIAQNITERIRRELDIPVIWGGTHATVAPEQSIQIADMLCLGEGEHALLELGQSLSKNHDVSGIQNLWLRTNDNIIKNPIRPLFQDVNSLPFPDYGKGNKYFVENETISNQDPGTQAFNLDIMTSRGCPYRCTYCSNSLLHSLYAGKGRLVRQRSVQNVIEEIKTQRELFPKLKRIDFIDEVFSWDKKWVQEFAAHYKREIGLPFHCMQHPNTTDEEIMRMLKHAGLELRASSQKHLSTPGFR